LDLGEYKGGNGKVLWRERERKGIERKGAGGNLGGVYINGFRGIDAPAVNLLVY